MNQKTALIFLFLTVAIDATGLGIIIPNMPTLIQQTAHVANDKAAEINGWLVALYAFMQFVFAPIMGGLSDQYGRRPILLLSLLGLGIDYIFLFFAPSLLWFFIGRAIAGIMGASFTPAFACIADIAKPEDRAKFFGIVGAAFGVGFVVGPAIGGLLGSFDPTLLGFSKEMAPRIPFLFAALLSLGNFIFGLTVFKETLKLENRRKFSFKRANPVSSIVNLKKYKGFQWLFFVSFLIVFCNMAVHSNWSFMTEAKFGWLPIQVGISLAVVGVCFALVQGGLSGFVIKKIGNKSTLYWSLGVLAVSFFIIGIAPQSWILYAVMLPYAFGAVAEPCIKALVSENTPANEQGELQGSFTSIMALGEVFGPPVMSLLYAFSTTATVGKFTHPFMLACLLSLVCLFLVRLSFKKVTQLK